jgi:hypothetical protein
LSLSSLLVVLLLLPLVPCFATLDVRCPPATAAGASFLGGKENTADFAECVVVLAVSWVLHCGPSAASSSSPPSPLPLSSALVRR